MEPSRARGVVEANLHLLGRPEVVSLDVGEKVTGGVATGRTALVVGVVEKRPPGALEASRRLPASVTVDLPDGPVTLPTDVVEEGEVTALAGPPYEGGTLVLTSGLKAGGSLGVNIVHDGRYRLLSCAHVLTAFDPNLVGAMVSACGPGWQDPVPLAPVTGQVPVTYYPSPDVPDPVYNTQDLAWADVTPEQASPAIIAVGVPSGLRAPKLAEPVRVYGGYTESLEHSSVDSVTAYTKTKSLSSEGSPVYSFWGPVARLDASTLALLPGDSGSAIVADVDDAVVGLAFSASMLAVYLSAF